MPRATARNLTSCRGCKHTKGQEYRSNSVVYLICSGLQLSQKRNPSHQSSEKASTCAHYPPGSAFLGLSSGPTPSCRPDTGQGAERAQRRVIRGNSPAICIQKRFLCHFSRHGLPHLHAEGICLQASTCVLSKTHAPGNQERVKRS